MKLILVDFAQQVPPGTFEFALCHLVDNDLDLSGLHARYASAELVFDNLRNNKRLTRFTLRGRAKVNGQWKLHSLAHNLEKLGHHGDAN